MTTAHAGRREKHRSGGFWVVIIVVILGVLCCFGMIGMAFLWLFLAVEEPDWELQEFKPQPTTEVDSLESIEPEIPYEEQAREELAPDRTETEGDTITRPDPPIEDPVIHGIDDGR